MLCVFPENKDAYTELPSNVTIGDSFISMTMKNVSGDCESVSTLKSKEVVIDLGTSDNIDASSDNVNSRLVCEEVIENEIDYY